MIVRRKSTTHDLATLRLHPDGSRVQQSSVNAGRRAAASTVVDPRGNWIAKDAGGKTFVKSRKSVHGAHAGDVNGEYIDFSGGEEATSSRSKGKQRIRGNQTPDEDAPQEPESELLGTRARRRLSFMRDLSFLDPPPVSISSLDQDAEHSDANIISFPDPASDLLKSIHHFASCYYRERGQLLDSSRDYRERKKEKCQQSKRGIHAFVANALEHQDINSEIEHTEMEDETTEEDADESEVMDVEVEKKERPNAKADTYRKDMYKAFDGSALMAMGIVLQEYVAHTLSSRPRASRGISRPKTEKSWVRP